MVIELRLQMKKLIDFETLCKNCDSHYWYDNVCQTEKDTCPIWNSLPDAQEAKKSNVQPVVENFGKESRGGYGHTGS
jgi:hypothetical protein